MEDYIVLKAGYHIAVNEILNSLQNLQDYDIIKDRIMRVQENYEVGKDNYKGNLLKYYDKEKNLGFILFDDIYNLKGVSLLVSEGKYKELEEKELVFVKYTMKPFWNKIYDDKNSIELKYNELLNNFKKIEP